MLLRSVYYMILVLLKKKTSIAYVTCYGNQCGGLLQKEDTSVKMIFFFSRIFNVMGKSLNKYVEHLLY